MSFSGFGGKDLTGISAKGSQLKPGLHQVKITSAKVEDSYDKKGKDLVVDFQSASGVGDFKHWITIHHSANPEFAEWGWREVVALLQVVGYQGKEAPDPSYFTGKNLRISIVEEYLKKINPQKPNIYSKRKIEQFLPFDGPTEMYEPLPPRGGASGSIMQQATMSQAPSGYNAPASSAMDDEIPF